MCSGWPSRWNLCMALVLLALGHALADSTSPIAIRAFNEGVKRFNDREYSAAVSHFDKAIAVDPDFPEALYARGACRYYLQSTDGALVDLNAAIRKAPELVDARSLRGVIYYESDRYDQALADFSAVLAQKPSDAQSLLGRGVIYLKREEMGKARRDLSRFLRNNPNDPVAPKLRELLASMPAGEEPEETSDTASGASSPSRARRRSAPSEPPIDVGALADQLFRRHALADKFGRQAVRGNRTEAVGQTPREPSGGSHPEFEIVPQ